MYKAKWICHFLRCKTWNRVEMIFKRPIQDVLHRSFSLQSALEISLLVLYNGKQREYVYTKKLTDGVRLYEQYYHDGIEQRTG